jgi:LAS superfamily LD-carboxypeptidase LdcB
MTDLFKKLNYKNQPDILVLNPPESFDNELNSISELASISRNDNEISEIEFALVFVTKQHEIDEIITRVFAKLKGDVVLWFCYPKGTSKKYKCDFNRDTGWQGLRKLNLETVRQVAIDDDWSALRFRKIEYIKVMNRKEENFNKGK